MSKERSCCKGRENRWKTWQI